MNAARLDRSARLQRVLDLLMRNRGGRLSTRQIVVGAEVMAVNSIASELRQNGYAIECERRGKNWYYWLG